MKIAKALKLKNQLAGEVGQLKELLTKQNSRSTKQKFDYDNREVLTRLRAKLEELIKVKAAVAAANAEIYDKIFRLAELKGLVATLTSLTRKPACFTKVAASVSRATKSNTLPSLERWTWTSSSPSCRRKSRRCKTRSTSSTSPAR